MKIINKGMPEPYCYESDYRKIPRKYLNPRIPRGRGNVKWQPFATMPEQFARIEQYMLDQNKIERPMLSEDQLNILNQKLIEKMFNHPHIAFKYFEDGYIKEINGYIHKVDVHNCELQLSINGEITKFSLVDIVEIN
ncbi:YolD-like family protein [Staphylococcus kloosii]|jgi:hypothetical protein|uniref:YolD-like family protein n=1 Tax=Staphylococcus kloosii TaxID=29384 RepID=A0ABQ0XI83_9STAP|nr:YolD-like family protein [Staphylococcus kloosii]AVQ35855.1 YolD-like family protein [Staphylococcus kloosii]MBF7021745.1 YolD-like family protein [Staphylococcus kloosii]PNZ01805.1 hypothetical protein CD136_13040 [Staphylococcus kloosii]SUM48925.1 YolD-like protein [Staphylococcus kloosii]GEP81158.1 hypothetical protein SKL01_03360 [Staphylococcus kloosii]